MQVLQSHTSILLDFYSSIISAELNQ